MCYYCKAQTTVASTTTHVVTLNDCIIIIRNVPCEECAQCGEKYFSDEVMARLEEIVDQARVVAGELLVTEYTAQVA